jgi:hypothetical protein
VLGKPVPNFLSWTGFGWQVWNIASDGLSFLQPSTTAIAVEYLIFARSHSSDNSISTLG